MVLAAMVGWSSIMMVHPSPFRCGGFDHSFPDGGVDRLGVDAPPWGGNLGQVAPKFGPKRKG